MIRLQGVNKKFGSFPALTDLSMIIPTGSIYGLIGVNGAGKTTLIKTMAGVLRADSGSIQYDGSGIWENTALKSKIALIPDELYFPEGYSLKNMDAIYSGIYPSWDGERFQELIGTFHLDPAARLRTFSKGMKKQAMFCLALAARPEYLLLDEPIDGLDPIVRRMVWNTIVDDVASRSMTVLISSHNLKELEGICDHIGILSHGRMLLEKDYDELRGDLHIVQAAYGSTEDTSGFYDGLDVLRRERRGSIDLLIIRGTSDEIEEHIQKHDPVVFDMLPLTLEEIFIYELGGENDEINELLS